MNSLNNIPESDLQLLEEHLDSALEAAEAQSLRVRLAGDSALALALVELQSQRALRQAAYRAMEPSSVSAQQLMWRVRGAMMDQQRQAAAATAFKPTARFGAWRVARFGSVAAACLVFGFSLGRIGHTAQPGATSTAPNTSNIASVNSRQPSMLNASLPGDQSPAGGHFVAVGTAPKISVPITDEYGRVVAFQTFDNTEQAKSFTEELHHAQNVGQLPVNSGQPRLVDQQQIPQVPF